MYTCPDPVIDDETIHVDRIPSMEAPSMMTVPLTDIEPYSSEHDPPSVTTAERATATKLTIDTVLRREILMMEYVYSTYNSQLPTTLTLYASTVVPCMDRVLLLERAT